MPGTTEPTHLYNGVFIANRGVFWAQADLNSNTVVTITAENIEYSLEDDELTYTVSEG